ncbi:MAG: response regulator [Desulfovibrionaceae bacterium]|nr:response regulator [Desulfovibrionaceae bacterium]MBF0513831.1 response regulator [Desulfovibrionaceae bacterium]
MPEIKRILAADDEEVNRILLEKMLSKLGHEPVMAKDGFDALDKIAGGIDLVLLDVMMPDMDGFEVVRRIRSRPFTRDIPVIMVTALSSRDDRLKAVEAGANDFIAKPVDMTELRVRMGSLLKMKEAQDSLKIYQANLEETVRVRTEALRLAVDNLAQQQRDTQAAHLDTVKRLAIASEYKDKDTADHIQRISDFCGLLGRFLDLSETEIDLLVHASPMHDVGKIGIADHILLKPGALDGSEWEIMKSHTLIGGKILKDSSSEVLQAGEIIALSHHEKWNGSGYPSGLSGQDIPIFGRICAVADVFDALTNKRPYKEAFSNEEALRIMAEGRGAHFDPQILDMFLGNLDAVLAIQHKYKIG